MGEFSNSYSRLDIDTTHLDTELLPSIEEFSSLKENGYNIPMISWQADWRSWPVLGRPGFWEVAYFLVTVLGSLVLLNR